MKSDINDLSAGNTSHITYRKYRGTGFYIRNKNTAAVGFDSRAAVFLRLRVILSFAEIFRLSNKLISRSAMVEY